MKRLLLVCMLGMWWGMPTALAQKEIVVDLAKMTTEGKLVPINRTVAVETDGQGNFMRVSEKEGPGVVWLPVEKFKSGKLTILMRGKDVLQKSFIGLIFHGINDSTYDAVYCRPFNFLAQDSVRRIHAIQYIAHPNFTWEKLRAEQNAINEKEIQDPPDPNGWFRMTLIIENNQIRAFINDKLTPSLTVKKLSNYQEGKLGIFTGSGSGGDFRSISIVYQ